MKGDNQIDLSSKENRVRIEQEFCTFVNQTILRDGLTVERIVTDVSNTIKNEAKESESNIIFRIAYDLYDPTIDPPIDSDRESYSFLNNKQFWQLRKQITIRSFTTSFQTFLQNKTQEGQVEFQVLKQFLKQLDELEVNHSSFRVSSQNVL